MSLKKRLEAEEAERAEKLLLDLGYEKFFSPAWVLSVSNHSPKSVDWVVGSRSVKKVALYVVEKMGKLFLVSVGVDAKGVIEKLSESEISERKGSLGPELYPFDPERQRGVTITDESVGKTFYSHEEACRGKLVRIKILAVEEEFIARVLVTFEKGGKKIEYSFSNKNGQRKSWEIVDLGIARDEILRHFSNKIETAERVVENLQLQRSEMLRKIEEEFRVQKSV